MEQEHNNNIHENKTQEEQKEFTPLHENHTAMAVIAYIIFFVPLLTDSKDDPFVKFHVKQGLVLFLVWAAINMVTFIIIPFLFFIGYFLQFGLLILAILGIINAAHGKQEKLPLIGQYADLFKF